LGGLGAGEAGGKLRKREEESDAQTSTTEKGKEDTNKGRDWGVPSVRRRQNHPGGEETGRVVGTLNVKKGTEARRWELQ